MTKHLRQRLCRPLMVLIFAALALPSWPSAGKVVAAAPVRLRIGVTRDGIVEIEAGDLGADVLALLNENPEALAMSSLGQPVASRVITDTLTGFKSLQFFGQRFRSTAAVHPEQEEKYTDERVYWLDIGGTPGLRITDINAAPRPEENLTPPNDFLTTVHAEESRLWWTLTSGALNPGLDQMDKWDTWFWDVLQTRRSVSETLDFPYAVPYPAPGVTATLRLEEIPLDSNSKCDPDHRTVIALTNSTLLDQTWDGKVRKVFTATVPADLLASGTNTVTVSAFNPPDLETCINYPKPPRPVSYTVYVNYWEIDYRRQFRAWDDQIDFRAEGNGPHEYLVSGWRAGPVESWDITDPNQPKRLVGAAVEPDGGGASLRFRAADMTGTRYWLQAADTIAGPASLRVRTPTGLRESTTEADAVIITPDYLRAPADRLAAWHEQHGRRALVVDLQDIYDEFNDGTYNPKAVPLMLAWAKDHWVPPAPTYLTLVGDGHWNFKNFNPARYPGGPNPIPPYLAWVDPWQGEVPADPLYGDLDFDGMPDVAVGRLAVNNVDEANAVVDKIVNYDENLRLQPWQRRALFVADWDYTNPNSPYIYQSLSDQIIVGYLPSEIAAQRAFLASETEADVLSVKTAISDALRNGVLMLQYSGHGDADRWSRKSIWNPEDVYGLQNGALLPVVMTFNCKDGYFAYPGRPSMAGTMQRQPNGGSVAAISPSGLGATPEQHAMRKLLMQIAFQDNVRELGNALLLAKQRYMADKWPYYQVATLMFYGDPAMRLPGPLPHGVYMPLALSTH
jgi:Peptidase family C25